MSRALALNPTQVLDGVAWASALPQLIEAVFYPVRGDVDVREGGAQQARRLHASFMEHYGLGAATFTPLLTFDVAAALDGCSLPKRRRAECAFIDRTGGTAPFAHAP